MLLQVKTWNQSSCLCDSGANNIAVDIANEC